jgi:MFS family permease
MATASVHGHRTVRRRGQEPVSPARVARAALIGTAIEWYDFFVYGTSSVLILGPLFFPARSPLTASLLAFSSFGIGFLVRPVGAVVLSHFGDRHGRKQVLVVSLLLMGGATLTVGLLPTHSQIGFWAPLLLVLLRCVQGFAVGGEWGGAVLLAIEHAPARRRAWYGSFPQYGFPLGLAASSLAILGASKLTGDQFLSWGWRLPFLLSSVLLVVGLWIRVRMSDAEEFLRTRRNRSILPYPAAELMRSYRRPWAIGVALTFVGHASYIFIAFLPAYATAALDLDSSWSLVALVVTSAAAATVLLVVGRRADRVDRRRYAVFGALFAGAWAFPAFALAGALRGPGLIVGMAAGSAAVAVLSAVLPVMLADQFPVEVRYTGVAMSHDTSAVLAGALLPILVTWLVGRSGGAYWPAAVMMLSAGMVSVIGATLYRFRNSSG